MYKVEGYFQGFLVYKARFETEAEAQAAADKLRLSDTIELYKCCQFLRYA